MRRTRLLLLFLMLLALALRVWYVNINPLLPQFSSHDDGDYYRRALRLAVTGQYVDDSWLIRPPFHVLVFASMIWLAIKSGAGPETGVTLAQALQIALGVAMVPLCYAIGRRLFNSRAGLVFAAFWAVWYQFVELPATLFTEPIYLFLFALHLWLLLRFDDGGRIRNLFLAGVVLGMAALTRSPALYALVFAVPWLVWRAYRQRSPKGDMRPWSSETLRGLAHAAPAALRPLAVLAAATLLVVLPWTARNWVVYHRLIVIDTLGPINLWLDLESVELRGEKIRALEALPQADRQAYAVERVRAILADEPWRPFRASWSTFRHIWKAQFVEDYFAKRSFFSRPLREAAWLGLPGDLIWLCFTFAGVVGLFHPSTDRGFKILILLWLAYSFVTVLVFHVEPRYLLPIWLLLGLYGSATLARFLAAIPLRKWPIRAALLVSSVAMLAWLFVTVRDYPAILSRGISRERWMRQGLASYSQGDYVAAEQHFRKAMAADPPFLDARVALAMALGAQGRAEEGLAVIPQEGSRWRVVDGVLRRATGDMALARERLALSEVRSGEDIQRWSLAMLWPSPRESLVLGDQGLDIGYISGFSGSEMIGERSMRWLLGDGTVILPLPQPPSPGSAVTLDLAAPLELEGPLEVVVQNRWRWTIQPEPGWRRYRFLLPPALEGARQLRVDLHAPIRLPVLDDPTSLDSRPLSVMVHRIAVEP